MKKVCLLATFLVVVAAFAQQSPTGQGPSALNGGLIQNFATTFPGAGPNNSGGPGLGRHDLQNANTLSPLGCESCHLPHTAPTWGRTFLWAWRSVPSTVMTYQTDTNPVGMLVSPALAGSYATVRSGNARSMLCLTCHDGTSANANGIIAAVTSSGAPFPLLMSTAGVGDMSAQHPVDAIIPVTADFQQPVPVMGGGVGMNSATATVGSNALPLWDTDYRVECTTCHDQHNDFQSNQGPAGGVPFLRVANTNGTYLCRQCHNK